MGQPHTADEGPIAVAEAEAARISTEENPVGRPGRPLNRGSAFLIGMAGAAGVAVTAAGAMLLITARTVLILIGLAFFIAVGLEPLVSWLVVHRLPRWAAVTAVFLAVAGIVGGFLAAAIPTVVSQATGLAQKAPAYLADQHSLLGQFSTRFGLQQQVQNLLSGHSPTLTQGVIGAGQVALSAATGLVVVVVLTIYFLADFPRIRSTLYRMAPQSRRPRTILIGDQVLAKVGGYVLGNVIVSVIAGVLTVAWLLIFHVPYPLLLAVLVALLDLVPVVGSIVGGVLVCLVALTVSLPVALATAGFFVVYRLAEDYLLVPRIIGRVVQVPSVVTVLAVLLGGALLGIIGALVAIPIAAALLLLVREVLFPRLDRS